MNLMTKYGPCEVSVAVGRIDYDNRQFEQIVAAVFPDERIECQFFSTMKPISSDEVRGLARDAIERECEKRGQKPIVEKPLEKIIVPGPVPGGFNPDPEAPFCITPDGIFVVFFDLGNEASRKRAEEIGDGYRKETKRNVILMSRMPKASRPFHTPPEPRVSGS
jgi:hypothetical protein